MGTGMIARLNEISAKNRIMGTIVPLDSSDLRNPDHPSQRANWLAFARELGAAVASEEWERLYGGADDEEGSDLCEVFERPAKGYVH
jgi:hypothetical protein